MPDGRRPRSRSSATEWESALGTLRPRARARAAPPSAHAAPTRPTCASSRPGPTARGMRARDAPLPRPPRLRGGALRAGAAKATVARKLAATRSLFDHCCAIGDVAAEPGRPAAEPEARVEAAPGARPRRDARPCSSGSRTHAARDPRPGDARARLLLRPALPGDDRPRLGSIDFDGERVRVSGKGGKTRIVPIGEPAQRALARYLRARAARRWPATAASPRCSSRKSGRRLSPSDVRRRLERWVREAAIAGRRLAARPAPLLRHPHARGRRGPALDPGAARPRERLDHPDLHARGAVTAATPVRGRASARMR